jgi:hypothetical protein
MFRVQYLSRVWENGIETAPLQFDDAIEFAHLAAQQNAHAIRQINVRQAQARLIRRAARLGLKAVAA